MTTFWQIYESLCREREIPPASQAQAMKIGATRAGIASWKTRGVIPRIETLDLIAQEFNVSIDYLTGRTSIRGMASEDQDVSGRRVLPRPIRLYYSLNASDQARVEVFMESLLASEEYASGEGELV